MQHVRKRMRYGVLAMLILIPGCQGMSVTTVSDSCGWVKQIILSPGALERLTREEKVQILSHNELVQRNCR